MADYVLSVLAQRDLTRALRYSLEEFGPRQTSRYDAQLRAALWSLAEDPTPGTPYRGKARGLHWLQCQRHVIFYRLIGRANKARVVRILHEAQLPVLHLR